MTFVGKVLVAVQLVMSLVFMAFAGAVYTAQTKWKEKAEKTQASADQAATKAAAAQAQVTSEADTVKKALADEKVRADGFQAQFDAEKKKFDLKVTEYDRLKTENETLMAQSQVSSQESGERKDEASLQRGINKNLLTSRNDLLDKVRQLEDQLFALNIENQTMNDKHNQALFKLAALENRIKQLGIDTDTLAAAATKEAPPPVVEGIVIDTKRGERDATEFVEISIGSDDGLLKGHDLFVYRNDGKGKYLGKIRLVYVTPDRAVGTVIQKAKNGVIQKGDGVASRL